MLRSRLCEERSGKRKERKSVEIAVVFSQIRTNRLEWLRMNSLDSEKISTTADITPGPILPPFPLTPTDHSISLPRSPRRPPIPHSPLELLPTEIHIEIIKSAAESTDRRPEYDSLCKLACASPIFTKLAQGTLYRDVHLRGERRARKYLESEATLRGEFRTESLSLRQGIARNDLLHSTTSNQVLALQTSALSTLRFSQVRSFDAKLLEKLSGSSCISS